MLPGSPQGVRAQPKSLRPPTTINSITSYLGGISSYVSQNLPDRLNWSDPAAEAIAGGDFDVPERVYSAKFCWVEFWEKRQLCLFLGYCRGFQVWNVSQLEDVREVVSVRDGIGRVHWIQAFPNPSKRDGTSDYLDHARPLIGYITELENTGTTSQFILQMYSMRSLNVVQTIKFGEDRPVDARVTSRTIAVSLASKAINVYSASTFQLLSTFSDIAPGPLSDCAVFDIGSRYIMYATSAAPPPRGKSLGMQSSEADSDDAEYVPDAGMARKVAGKVAKDLVVGAKAIGGYGYQALSNYFSSGSVKGHGDYLIPGYTEHAGKGGGQYITIQGKPKDPVKADPYADMPKGVVVLRALPTVAPSASNGYVPQPAAIAHWKPHNNPVSLISFSPNQTIAITASVQANTFYLWELPGRSAKEKTRVNVRCLYKLERGYTMATIESVTFSLDSKWVGVTTARGTTHVYRINPSAARDARANAQGGAPQERLNIVNGISEPKPVNGASFIPAETGSGIASVYPVARIKRQPVGDLDNKLDGNWESLTHRADIDTTQLPARAPLIAAFMTDRPSLARDRSNGGKANGYDRRASADHHFSSLNSASASSRSHTPTDSAMSPGVIRLHRQRLITFNPSDTGSLMLHHIDVNLEDHSTPPVPSPSTTLFPSPKKSLSGPSPHSFERFSPSSMLASAFPGWGTGRKGQQIRVNVADVMEWKVKRESDWVEVKRALQATASPRTPSRVAKTSPARGIPSPPATGAYWPAKIEICTYEPVKPPVWMGPQFVFQVFDSTDTTGAPSPAENAIGPDLSDLPPAYTVYIRKEAPKPYGDEKKPAPPSGHFPVLNGGDTIPEGISTAMDSMIRFEKVDPPPVPTGLADSVSFEDAYHIHVVARRSGYAAYQHHQAPSSLSPEHGRKSLPPIQNEDGGQQQQSLRRRSSSSCSASSSSSCGSLHLSASSDMANRFVPDGGIVVTEEDADPATTNK
ncbi:hypothetical protein DFS34DRAFT_645882 [Phlyctochytrium arcticum]|nr:hypothetical protein DFS34DRAFT_645882 [Phlyctochytrium arcticum]